MSSVLPAVTLSIYDQKRRNLVRSVSNNSHAQYHLHGKVQSQCVIDQLRANLSHQMIELLHGPTELCGEQPQPKRLQEITAHVHCFTADTCLHRI